MCRYLTHLTVLLVAAASIATAQTNSTPLSDNDLTRDLPTVTLTFSEPSKLDSPLELPSTIMGGPPICGPGGRAFIQFMTPPPMYNYKVVESVSADGTIVKFPLERIQGLTKVAIVSFDPGATMATMLVRATVPGQPSNPRTDFFLVLFDYDGKFKSYSKLDLGFLPSSVSQVTDDSFLVIGTDVEIAKARLILINSDGVLLRDLDADSVMPSESALKSMFESMNTVGMSPLSLPPPARINAALSLFHPVHFERGLLILEPGAGARVVELLASGETHVVKLKLPPDQLADSLITNKGRWFVRTFLHGTDDQINLYEVDPDNGFTTKRIVTSGVPASSIACPYEGGFFGFRWLSHKPYLIFGTFQ